MSSGDGSESGSSSQGSQRTIESDDGGESSDDGGDGDCTNSSASGGEVEGTGLGIDVEPPWPVGWSPDDWCKDLKLPFQCEQLRILLPCAGFDAPGRALRHMKIPYRLAGLWEIDESASRVLRKMHSGGSDASALHIGRSAGDFLKVSAQDLPNADALISGPPCPPFSRIGLHGGWKDERAGVFLHILWAIKELVRRGCLKWFIIENVVGVLAPQHAVWRRLRGCVDDKWRLEVLKMTSLSQGQSRPRLYIVGWLQRSNAGPHSSLREQVPDLPNRRLSSILLPLPDQVAASGRQAANLRLWLKRLRPYCEEKKRRGTLACVPMDRRPQKSFASFRIDDCSPCLRASGTPLWIISLGEGTPRVCRPLHVYERCLLQGIDPLTIPGNVRPSAIVRGCGNAMTVAIVGTVMFAVLCRLHQVEQHDRRQGMKRAGEQQRPSKPPKTRHAEPSPSSSASQPQISTSSSSSSSSSDESGSGC